MGKSRERSKSISSAMKRYFFIISGFVFLSVGFIGIIIPLLPTTPFLLLSAACFARGSKRCYNWLMKNKWFGRYIKNYYEKKGIPLTVKVLTILVLWMTILVSFFFFVRFMWIKILLICIALIVTLHIILIKTYH